MLSFYLSSPDSEVSRSSRLRPSIQLDDVEIVVIPPRDLVYSVPHTYLFQLGHVLG